VDGVHSFLPMGVAFSWTRHGATLVGGAIFALVWLPLPAVVARGKQYFILMVAVLSLTGALAIWGWPERLPAAWVTGQYSRLVIATNALGGLGFLAAAVFFIRRYLREPQGEDLVFASHTLLFGTASLFFGFSHVWGADWWVWHGARLLAYSVVLVAAYTTVVALYQQIAGHAKGLDTANAALRVEMAERKQAEEEVRRLNAELEQRVLDRTAQLEAANRELETFSYSVSHDLRSPLRAIDGFSRVLLEEYYNTLDEEGKRLLDVIRFNTQKMDQLITDLLVLSRVSRTGITFSRIDMTTLSRSIYHESASPDDQSKFDFSVAPLPDAYGDPTLMRQVWSNLLSNAIKFTMPKDARKIEIGGRTENGMNIYYVKDTGVGFNPDYTHKLFDLFQRLHKTEEFEGTGVGLAIVQRIIHRHGGRTWAEGVVDKGATFYFSLPK